MFARILKIMRDKIRQHQYLMTLHAEEEMEDDGLSIYDIESCILNGEIMERQKDIKTAEWKYCINGRSIVGKKVAVIAKLGPTEKLIFITVYSL